MRNATRIQVVLILLMASLPAAAQLEILVPAKQVSTVFPRIHVVGRTGHARVPGMHYSQCHRIQNINRIYADEDASIMDLAKAVEHDPMIIANLLKAANSPLYGFSREINAISQAVFYLRP